MVIEIPARWKGECEHEFVWSDYCGARVCTKCSDHKGLIRCYCGWKLGGGDGLAELIAMGETIEPDDY